MPSCGDWCRSVWGSMSASASPRTSMQLWTRPNGLRWSSAAVAVVHPWTRLGQPSPLAQRTSSPDSGRAGSRRPPFPPPSRLRLPVRCGYLDDRADREPQQCGQLGLVEDCGWTGQCGTHPCPVEGPDVNRWNAHKTSNHDNAGNHNKSCEAESPRETHAKARPHLPNPVTLQFNIIKISLYYIILYYFDIELLDSCRSSRSGLD